MSAIVYPSATAAERAAAVDAVVEAVQGGRTAVIPTDTVYGIAADAFSPGGVGQLLSAKGRSRRMPPPVLVSGPQVLPALGEGISDDALALADAFWPGAMTLIVTMNPSLNWDLGETSGTVALRVPDDDLAREILERTGPLAVSSANRTGRTAATTAQEAEEQLGERVQAIVDGGIRPVDREPGSSSEEVLPSTIIDCTGERPVLVRAGAIGIEAVREVVGSVLTREELRQQRAGSSEPGLRSHGDSAAGGASAGDQGSGEHSSGEHSAVLPSADEQPVPGAPGAAVSEEDPEGLSAEDGPGPQDARPQGPGEGPRAGTPRADSVAAALTAGAVPGRQGADQLRRRPERGGGTRPRRTPAAAEQRPLSVSEARALVLGRSAARAAGPGDAARAAGPEHAAGPAGPSGPEDGGSAASAQGTGTE